MSTTLVRLALLVLTTPILTTSVRNNDPCPDAASERADAIMITYEETTICITQTKECTQTTRGWTR
jgi:hypothetical protein